MKLSIVVVSFNTREFLERCLSSIVQHTKIPYEIVVVDNHSSDGSVAHLKAKFPDVKVIVNETNVGFSRANNIGARSSKGEYLMFLNSDTEVREGAIDRLVGFLEGRSEVAIVGPRIVYPDGRFQLSAGNLPGIRQELRDRGLYRRIQSGDEALRAQVATEFQQVRDVGWVTASCLLIRRSVYEAIGGFDESLFMYFEDKDLCKRVIEHGVKVVYYPEAEVVHSLGGSSTRDVANLKRIYRNSQRTYYRKHHGWLSNVILQLYLGQKKWTEGFEFFR